MRRALFTLLCLAACNGTEDDDGPAPDFPADYAASYVEVRDCRTSGDHDLNYVRMLADPVALSPYENRDAPFPVGAVVIKEEYDFTDTDCSGAIKQWTVMTRLADGTAPAALDWRWQRVDADRNVVGVDTPRCYGCHTGCGVESEGGYEGTCAHP
ncbi:MAG: cytochrome P460 family protein [Deltaproteobacteria bacterium]